MLEEELEKPATPPEMEARSWADGGCGRSMTGIEDSEWGIEMMIFGIDLTSRAKIFGEIKNVLSKLHREITEFLIETKRYPSTYPSEITEMGVTRLAG